MKSNKIFILMSTVLLLLLGGSIYLNAQLYQQAKKYYFEVNETRLDPFGLSEYPATLEQVSHDSGADQSKIRVVFFGDSRAAGWVSPNASGYEFINRGISSQTTAQTIQRFAYHVNPLQPDVVVIQVGVNDLKTVALFPRRKDEIIANCRANIQQIVDEARRLGATVILTTILPTGEVPLERRPFWSDEIDIAIQEVNAYIATLAEDQVIVFDAFSLLANDQGKMVEAYRSDELHFNEQAYVLLNQKLVPLLDTI
ncbi:MAG: GDSL-type esterase/lipase family protein [Cyanobacteria bacterium P01_A01_bin.123]